MAINNKTLIVLLLLNCICKISFCQQINNKLSSKEQQSIGFVLSNIDTNCAEGSVVEYQGKSIVNCGRLKHIGKWDVKIGKYIEYLEGRPHDITVYDTVGNGVRLYSFSLPSTSLKPQQICINEGKQKRIVVEYINNKYIISERVYLDTLEMYNYHDNGKLESFGFYNKKDDAKFSNGLGNSRTSSARKTGNWYYFDKNEMLVKTERWENGTLLQTVLPENH